MQQSKQQRNRALRVPCGDQHQQALAVQRHLGAGGAEQIARGCMIQQVVAEP
ncbi:MAG TPA: hypothetical protein VK898_04835 [Chloroflexota bacterium]|nr:hypothetical protein [Chloroflexota bacterium]